MKKTISTLALAGTIFLSTFAMAADLIQKDGNGRFQAKLQNVPLSDIARFMETEHEVKFKGEAELLKIPVTVSFQNLDMEEMLKKILARNNYVFSYNKSGKITEVKILNSTAIPSVSNQGRYQDTNTLESKEASTSGKADPGHLTGINSASPDTADDAKGEQSIMLSPDGDNVDLRNYELTAEEKETFKVVPDSPPPGAVLQGSDGKTPDDF